MPRPKRCRVIKMPPEIKGFQVVGSDEEDKVILHFEEFEALRLSDYKNLTQDEAAKSMQVSRPTFTRIYDNTLKKLAKAFVEGKSIEIAGGNVRLVSQWYKCKNCDHIYEEEIDCPSCNSEDRKNLNNEIEFDSSRKICVCRQCGYEVEHQKGIPCKQVICPECQLNMTRK